MPEVGSQIVSWGTFTGGEYGTAGGRNAPAGTFTARNMLVYANGTVGPRPGLKNMTPNNMPNGKLLCLVSTPVVGRDGLFIIGNTVYRFNLGNPASDPVIVGTFATTPTVPLHPYLVTDVFYVAVPNDKCYRIDPTNDQVTAVTGVGTSPGGRDLVIWNQQMIVACDGHDASHPLYRLMASKPGDVNDWSEGRFIDSGDDNWQVTGLRIQRNTLAILKRNGVYELTGILGDPETEVERRAVTPTTTLQPYHADMDALERYWFIPVFEDFPAEFSGGTVNEFPRIKFDVHEHDEGDSLPQLQGLAMLRGDLAPSTIVCVRGGSTQQMLISQNNAWTKHDIGVIVSGMCGGDRVLLVTSGGTNSTPAQIYMANLLHNRPAFVGDVDAAPGDNSSTPMQTHLTVPQHWETPGRETRVRQVIVDFDTWDTGSTTHNHFDVTVKVMGRDANRGAASELAYTTGTGGQPNSFDQATSASSTSGTSQRQVFDFRTDYGAGFEISIVNNRGCAIADITVMHQPRQQRPMN